MPSPPSTVLRNEANRVSRAQIYLLAVAIGFVLYFYGLDRAGVLGPDEPRYASIGREMARSGDWVTPRLWGKPWFEKPALVYWLTGISFKLGLNEDLAPRIPVALISVGFLVFFYREVRRQFGDAAGWYATAVLGTSAGWLAYSQVGVMDLPLAASFAACVLLCVEPDPRREVWAGVMLGAGMLAKGLVPLVLAIPLFAWLIWGRRWRALGLVVVAGALTAAPWYVLCTMQNGRSFLVDFFWKHHFERFATDVLQHRQPFWYYIPVIAGGMFPWSILLALLPGRSVANDRRLILFAGTAMFGFLFFSASVNKLPGYVIPLLPFVAILLGWRMAEVPSLKWWLAGVAVCLAAYPWIGKILPSALSMGITRASLAPGLTGLAVLPAALLAWQCWRLDRGGKRELAVGAICVITAACVLYLKWYTIPRVDATYSARPIWQRIAPVKDFACAEELPRTWMYGLSYYAGAPLPRCSGQPVRLVPGSTGRPIVMESEIIR